jgi:LuxR family transcriptional regulator, maltose regulon positive regulatory protein
VSATAKHVGPTKVRPRRMPPWFVPLESKLHVPATRPGLVARPRLLEQLRAAQSSPLVLVVGPAGYGKTTLLTQWGEKDERPFVWVTIDDTDNDASRLLANIVVALDEVIVLGPGIFPRPPEPGKAFVGFALPRLTRALSRRARPFVLVIDDVHVLHDRDAIDTLAMLVQNLPPGSQLVLAGREVPPIPLSRLLTNSSVVTLGTHQLSMTPYEGVQLLHAAGLPVGGSEAAMLVERTEGWPAGLYLAALALREREHLGRALETFAGSQAPISDYLNDEILERLPKESRTFMLGTAALDRMCGPLCDAVLGAHGSSARLEEFARANLFLVPTDRSKVWFRRHQLFADVLRAELRRRNPERERIQHRRAAAWFEANGNTDEALAHARAAGDMRLAAELIAGHVVAYVSTGRASTLRRWIEQLPVDALTDLPWFGAAAALAYVSSGDVARATHWLAVAERGSPDDGPLPDGRASLGSAVAITRASLGFGDVAQLLRDATTGYDLEPRDSLWRGVCAFLRGAALCLVGDIDAASAALREAIASTAMELPNVHAWSLAQLAVCSIERDDWEAAREEAERARVEVERNGLQEYAAASAVYAVSALTCARWHQPTEARRDAARARRLFAMLSGLMPWMSVQGAVLTSNAYLLLGDPGEAREVLRGTQRYLPHLPDAVRLRARFDEAYTSAMSNHKTLGGPPLTAAEIRVVQYLPTHLSFREIAERLHVSRNTVKTQVISSYRKLGAANRTEAVERAKELAILA